MKKMKKILAFVLAMAMVLGMTVTSFAENDEGEGDNSSSKPATVTSSIITENVKGTNQDRGTITVQGIEAEVNALGQSSIEVYACQIVEPVYDAKTGYFTSKYTAKVDALNENGEFDSRKLTAAVLGELKKNMELNDSTWSITTGEGKSATGDVVTMTKSAEGYYYASVPVGSYLVLVKGSEAKFYSPIVVSASYVGDNGQSGIQNDILNIENGVAWVKVSDTPDLTKTADVPNRDIADTNTDNVSVNIGDVIDYTITVTPIPNYDGAHPKFKITDTLNEGLDYTFTKSDTVTDFESSIVVMAGNDKLEKDTDYTVTHTTNTRTFVVDFVVDGDYKLKEYAEDTLTITYKAKVNNSAKVNSAANENEVKLEYSKDSNIEGDEGEITKKTFNYTFDLSTSATGSEINSILNKVGEVTGTTTTTVPLKGATFTLYKDEACNVIYENDYMPNGTVVSATGVENGIEEGALIVRGLAAGTYYMKETVAPAGYTLNTDVYKIEIDATYYTDATEAAAASKEVGELKEWEVTITKIDVNGENKLVNPTLSAGTIDDTTRVDIPNTKLASLPSTGGIGTTIFTIGGCAIMILAAGLFFATRRKAEK